ncbi:MAG: hypothetical protein Q9188_000565 [Gyalolechia gomerana]
MAPSATNVDSPATPTLPDEVSKPPAGIVLPPRDIRAIVEKTAGYVARNGAVFEDRIREKEKHNPKFSFLSINDAYNPFYSWRLTEVREGRGTAVSAGRVGEPTAVPEPEKPKGPAAPPDFHFSARMPNISAQDLDVVKLTALFVAKNGRSFMTALSQKETRNYQFDFLRPQHSLYQFFSRLVDQYTLLLQAVSAEGAKARRLRVQELEKNASDRFNILDAAKMRAAWVKYQEEQRQKKEEEAEKEKLEYAQIDWHDFVVVETVLFEEADDQADLPPPPSLNDLQSASLEQKAAMSLQPHDRRIEEAMPTADDYGLFYNQQQQQQQMPPPSAVPSYPTYDVPQTMDYQPTPQLSTAVRESEEDRAIAERAEARERAQAAHAAAKGGAGQPMRIRNDYVPRAQAKRQNVAMAVCPNCSQQIPYDELEQHMRIELLDPRWKEQRLKFDQRQSTTNLSTSDVAANLKRLASQRSDVFDGVTGQPVISEEEAARRKKAALNYDGQLEKGKEMERRQGMNIDEQIRQIHQKFNQSG